MLGLAVGPAVLIPILFVGFVLLGLFLLSRSRELFRIEIQDGKQTVVRGYVPAGLLNDFGSAIRHVGRGTISAHKASGHARLSFGGDIDAGAAQRLRNIFGLYPVARLRGPRIDARQTASDVFLVGSLLSFFRNLFR